MYDITLNVGLASKDVEGKMSVTTSYTVLHV